MQRAIDVFEDGLRKFQMEENKHPKLAFCDVRTFAQMLDAWMTVKNKDASVSMYGIKIIGVEDHGDGFTFE